VGTKELGTRELGQECRDSTAGKDNWRGQSGKENHDRKEMTRRPEYDRTGQL
jgi:hypothetical protein